MWRKLNKDVDLLYFKCTTVRLVLLASMSNYLTLDGLTWRSCHPASFACCPSLLRRPSGSAFKRAAWGLVGNFTPVQWTVQRPTDVNRLFRSVKLKHWEQKFAGKAAAAHGQHFAYRGNNFGSTKGSQKMVVYMWNYIKCRSERRHMANTEQRSTRICITSQAN